MATTEQVAANTGLDMETSAKVAEAMLIPPALTETQGVDNDISIFLDCASEQMFNEAENGSFDCIVDFLTREWNNGNDDIAFLIRTAVFAGIAIGKGEYIG